MKTLGMSLSSISKMISLPINIESVNLGILVLEYPKDQLELPDKLLKPLGSLASVAIGNAMKACLFSNIEHMSDLFLESMGSNDHLKKLVNETRRVFGPEFHCEIFLYDPVQELLELKASTMVGEEYKYRFLCSSKMGLNGWVIQQKKVIAVSDVANNPRAIQQHTIMI